MIQENVTGSSYTFYWDGKNDSGAYVEPWTYTFEVDITQTDINYNENPALQVADDTEYRSRYLHILRSRDAFNNPIYEAEYAGYDEGDPNDPNDDSCLYYIRFYDLKDTLDVDASEGELQLYDPNLEQIYTWDVADLECLVEGHAECDGLHASSTGIMHELLVPVPVSVMQEDEESHTYTFIFVLHIKDDHPYKYRDHRRRWALELNGSEGRIDISIYVGKNAEGEPRSEMQAAWTKMKLKVQGQYLGYPWGTVQNGMNYLEDDNWDYHQMRNIVVTPYSSGLYYSMGWGGFFIDANRHTRSISPLIWIYHGHSCPANAGRDLWLKVNNSPGRFLTPSGTNSSDYTHWSISQIAAEKGVQMQYALWGLRLAILGACHSDESAFPSAMKFKGAENIIAFSHFYLFILGDYFINYLFWGSAKDQYGEAFDGLIKNNKINLDDVQNIVKTMKLAQERAISRAKKEGKLDMRQMGNSAWWAVLHASDHNIYYMRLPGRDMYGDESQ
jgi:hypothetical protein